CSSHSDTARLWRRKAKELHEGALLSYRTFRLYPCRAMPCVGLELVEEGVAGLGFAVSEAAVDLGVGHLGRQGASNASALLHFQAHGVGDLGGHRTSSHHGGVALFREARGDL